MEYYDFWRLIHLFIKIRIIIAYMLLLFECPCVLDNAFITERDLKNIIITISKGNFYSHLLLEKNVQAKRIELIGLSCLIDYLRNLLTN